MDNHFKPLPLEKPKPTYHLRLHTHEDELVAVAEWVRDHSLTCFIVREHATRVHAHCIFASRKNIEQWRKDFRLKFPHLKGNRHYGLKDTRSEIGLEDYLCKGGERGELPDILARSPFWTDEIILSHHNSYHDRHMPEVKANELAKQGNDIVTGNGSKTTIRTPTAIERIAQKCRKDSPDREWRYSCPNDRRIVYRAMMNRLGDLGKGFDLIVLKRIFNGVLHQLDENGSTDHFEHLFVDA